MPSYDMTINLKQVVNVDSYVGCKKLISKKKWEV